MKRFLKQAWFDEEGVLSFEWVLLLTLLAIGIVGGLAGARDAIIDELGDLAEAAISIDQSFTLGGNEDLGLPGFSFEDTKPAFSNCTRTSVPAGQPPSVDEDS